MVGVIGVQRPDERNLVDAAGNVGEQPAHLGSTLAVLAKFPLRALQKDPRVIRPVADLRMVKLDLLADVGDQAGLGIERVNVRHAAGHEEEDDILGLGRKVGRSGASGSAGLVDRASPASSSWRIPGIKSEPATNERSTPRRGTVELERSINMDDLV